VETPPNPNFGRVGGASLIHPTAGKLAGIVFSIQTGHFVVCAGNVPNHISQDLLAIASDTTWSTVFDEVLEPFVLTGHFAGCTEGTQRPIDLIFSSMASEMIWSIVFPDVFTGHFVGFAGGAQNLIEPAFSAIASEMIWSMVLPAGFAVHFEAVFDTGFHPMIGIHASVFFGSFPGAYGALVHLPMMLQSGLIDAESESFFAMVRTGYRL